MELESERIYPCYTELQLITNLFLEICERQGLKCTFDVRSPQILVILIKSAQSVFKIRLIQIIGIIKIEVTLEDHVLDSLWINCSKHISKKLSNTYSLNNVTQTSRDILSARLLRCFGLRKTSLLEHVLQNQLLSVSIMKYITFNENQKVIRLSLSTSHSLDSNPVYKALYEGKFGKTGFGLNLDWKTNYRKKCQQKELRPQWVQ